MNIYTVNFKNETLLPPHITLFSVDSFLAFNHSRLAAPPALVLVKAIDAEAFLQAAQSSEERSEYDVVILEADAAPERLRYWTQRGAQQVWLWEQWEVELTEWANVSEVSRIDESPLHLPMVSQRTVTIAVASTANGGGATHSVILLGRLLTSMKYKVALIECNPGSKDFTCLHETRGAAERSRNLLPNTTRFATEEGMDLYTSGMNPEEIRMIAAQDRYDYVIYDIGCLADEQTSRHLNYLFFTSTLQLLVSSAIDWRIRALSNILTSNTIWPQKNLRILLPHATAQQREAVAGVLQHRFVDVIPTIPDCFGKWSEEASRQLRGLISPVLPQERKRLFGMTLPGLR